MTAADQVLDLCARIAAYTDVPGTITRTFLSPATHQVHTLLRAEMEALGMAVRTDNAGNLRGLYPAAAQTDLSSFAKGGGPASVLLLGSHIDTVPNAGRYDGILGVALPIVLIKSLVGERLPFAIEVIAFSEEEGVRFKLPFIGSRALAGTLDPATVARTDSNGISIAQALRDFGLDPDDLTNAALTPSTFAFLEIHIEQGPVLESLDLSLGIVDTIVGQSRFEFTFHGEANHAGTTPMHLRKDALAGAAEFLLAVENFARTSAGFVATVGILHAAPGAANIIPGTASCSLDIRHSVDASRESAAQLLLDTAQNIAAARKLSCSVRQTSTQAAVAMDPTLRAVLGTAAAPFTPHTMPSGAGHDAMILAAKVPAAMLFLRTPRGLSHHPEEAVSAADIQAAFDICLRFLHSVIL